MSDNETKVSILPKVPKSIDNALENLTDLPTKGIGQTIADCWYLVFGGISQKADKKRIKYAIELENFKAELNSSISSVPESMRREPSSQIVLSALDNAKYCVEEKELRDLFTALLTSSIDSTKTVHPSFSHIISRMSSADARMLKCFSRETYFPICDIYHSRQQNDSIDILEENVFIDGPDDLSISEKSLSVSALLSFGLIEIPSNLYESDDSQSSRFRESEPYLSLLAKYPQQELRPSVKPIRLSGMGKLFVSCCITKRVYGTID